MQNRLSERLLKKELNTKIVRPMPLTEAVAQRIKDRKLAIGAPSTGFPSLDILISGFIAGKLYCLSGRTNVGKSATAATFAVNVAQQGKKVLFIALEPDVDIVDYFASAQLNKPYKELTDYDLTKINPNIEIYIKDQIPTVERMIEIIHALPRYDLIIVDHIGYFIKGNSNGGTLQEQDNVTKDLVSLAKHKKTAIMFIHHMRKEPTSVRNKTEARLPTIDDLKGSSSFGQDSTDVIFVTRDVAEEGYSQETSGKIIVAKTKSGGMGVVPVYFHEKSAKISEATNASYDIF